MGKDYFVVVQTIEAGKPVVTVVPHKCVSGNSLFWPSKQANELRQNAASSPASSWTKMPCSVKRKYIPTFKGAEQEGDELSGQSTDASDFAPKRKKKLKKGSTTKELDLNHLLTDQKATSSFQFTPVNTTDGIDALEENLKNELYAKQLLAHMKRIIGHTGDACNGLNVVYGLIDHFFDRNLMLVCSWTGESRGEIRKYSMKNESKGQRQSTIHRRAKAKNGNDCNSSKYAYIY
ncbi:hypothetical protein RP20_CCG025359 [Aedes albopictus]|nr:hypothetical protein RP20_CCG025359 [Aedes albopictus]